MDYSIPYATINIGWSIVYIKGSHVIFKQDCIYFSEDHFCLSKQCRPIMKFHIMQHLILVTVCQSKHLVVASIQRVNTALFV